MSIDVLSAIVHRLIESNFPKSKPETQEKFLSELIQAISNWRKREQTRTFSVGSDLDERETNDAEIQTDDSSTIDLLPEIKIEDDDRGMLNLLASGKISHRELEKHCDSSRAVNIRRKHLREFADLNLNGLPFRDYNYENVNGACCENLIGYVPMPTGIVGPIKINDERLYVPMATTEGALIASTNRGCKALVNGVTSIITKDIMTRSPVLLFNNIRDLMDFKNWVESPSIHKEITAVFQSTSRFCKLVSIDPFPQGNTLFLIFAATTGDAMGMNMISKACSAAMDYLKKHKDFEGKFKVLSLSGNMCVDKKASALNWIKGRGKSVIAEATVPYSTVENVLKCSPQSLVELANAKLSIGSQAAVCIGGSNAHAANIVAAMFIATGQDAAQVVSSSMCATEISLAGNQELKITCTMRCLEVGTVGGGTILGPQHAMLKMLGCGGSNLKEPGNNAKRLATIICATVLAGELSLLAAQCSNDLVRSHMKLNRSAIFEPQPQKSMEVKTVLTSNNRLSQRFVQKDKCDVYCAPI